MSPIKMQNKSEHLFLSDHSTLVYYLPVEFEPTEEEHISGDSLPVFTFKH
jgi:hypothetical protein